MAREHADTPGASTPTNKGKTAAQRTGVLFDPGERVITRENVGEDVVLSCRGLRVVSFRRGDELGRDIAIAALIRLDIGLITDTIGELCGASHGWVCEVRKRYLSGGTEAVIARAQLGPPRLLAGRKEERLRDLHGEGRGPTEIGKHLGVSPSLVRKEIKRHGLPPRGWAVAQQGLPGVGSGTSGQRKSRAAKGESAALAVSEEPKEPEPPGAAENGKDAEGRNDTTPEKNKRTSTGVDLPGVEEVPVGKRPKEEDSAQPALGGDGKVEPTVLEAEEPTPSEDTELMAGERIASGPFEHPCRYAGTLLLCAAAVFIGVASALDAAKVKRPITSVYGALEVLLALMAAWSAGYRSLEAMHERDARALGLVLGQERCPSVRTMHRAIGQMTKVFDPVELDAGLMRGLLLVRTPERFWVGADGHFKAYSGTAPIDKGWDSKRRIAAKGVLDVMITDEQGWTWQCSPVLAGDSLSKHLLARARTLRGIVGTARPIVVASDRGGFDFKVLNQLDADEFSYVGYVPWSVSLPELSTVAPKEDGIGEALWTHHRLTHKARLIVERDGNALIPMVTNLTTLVDVSAVVDGLRGQRGAQENSFKAGRAFVHIDALVDRGGATFAPDDRAIANPARVPLKRRLREVEAQLAALKSECPQQDDGGRSLTQIAEDQLKAQVERSQIRSRLRATPAKVPRVTIDPRAKRATLKTRNRLLLQPLKYAADNARRWLLDVLGPALAPTDRDYDQSALPRTLLALLDAPGTVRFEKDVVTVTLDLPLPPTAHRRLAEALKGLDSRSLRFTDANRRVLFRLAPRPTRESLPPRA
jgi:hypothetical protein